MARKKNIFANRTSTVAVTRNGLSIEIANVPAVDAALVAAELLRGVRGLIDAGFDELVLDGAAYHAGHTDQPEEPDDPEFVLPTTARMQARRQIGFTVGR